MNASHVSRRSVCAALASASLLPSGFSACAAKGARRNGLDDELNRLVNGPPLKRVPAAGFVLMRNHKVIAEHTVGWAAGLSEDEKSAGIDRRLFDATSPFRCASISKLATALTTQRLHKAGVLSLDEDVSRYLPTPLRHPSYPERPISLRQLLSHTSGLIDPDVYWVAYPHSIGPLLTETLFEAGHAPGEYFHYCNLNYGIAATVLETASDERFDRLAERLVFSPLGLTCGFNWSGVPGASRRNGATLYREAADGWEVQVDGPDTLKGTSPSVLIDGRSELSTYTPGSNGTLFSPQGGLRASLRDLAVLADVIGKTPELTTPVWTLSPDRQNGAHDDRYFETFGTGVHLHSADHSPWPGQTLVGHHGDAYGLYAGAFYAPQLDVSLAFAVTGTPATAPTRGSLHSTLNQFTAPVVESAVAAFQALQG